MKHIIVEIIPTTSKRDTGVIAQISALKLDGLKLIDRFDYRLNYDLLGNNDIIKLINYDKDKFNYVNSSSELEDMFKLFVEDIPLLLIEGNYTKSYLSYLDNDMELVYKYLNMEYSDDIFNKIVNKYKLEYSNYLVDLIYEALIMESNNSKSML